MSNMIKPGSTIGVLGSGQLGRMFAIAARRMGYRVHVLSPDDDTPTGQVADVEIQSPYDDLDAVKSFAKHVDVVTFEFENIPFKTIDVAERYAPVRPAGSVLYTTQQRRREKTFLHNVGLPVTPFQVIRSPEELRAISDSRFPAVLKTTAWGYDGKGQVAVQSSNDLASAWRSLDTDEAVLEEFVDFEHELSIVAARDSVGNFVSYGPILNIHRNHILDVSVTPWRFPREVTVEAVDIARQVMNRLEVVGVLCVEFFLASDGRLLINELAPRPHNSGHLTVDGHVTCQFEQQVRAVCGLPLGSTGQLRPAAMANLLGDCWQSGAPLWQQAVSHPNVKLHLYGKQKALPGRKMGHLTAMADTSEEAMEIVTQARTALTTNASILPTEFQSVDA